MSSGNKETDLNVAFCCIQLYTSGTMNNAAMVDAISPPITALPNGAD